MTSGNTYRRHASSRDALRAGRRVRRVPADRRVRERRLHERIDAHRQQAWVDAPEPSDFGPTAWRRRERLAWCGIDLAVPALDLQLAVTRRRGLTERAARIEESLRRR